MGGDRWLLTLAFAALAPGCRGPAAAPSADESGGATTVGPTQTESIGSDRGDDAEDDGDDGDSTASIPEYPDGALAFVGVDVVTMVGDEVLHDQTVVIADETIIDIRPTSTLPENVSVEHEGGWLMPGLIDMHAHVGFEGDLVLLSSFGITSIRNMFGHPQHLAWRDLTASAAAFGPTIVTAGPIVDGDPPVWPNSAVLTDPSDAEALVEQQLSEGYDAVKVYARLDRDSWQAVLDAATARDVTVWGHAPDALHFLDVIQSSQDSLEHLDGFLEAAANRADRLGIGLYDPTTLGAVLDEVDEARVSDLANIAGTAALVHCPTITVFRRFANPGDRADDLARYIHPAVVDQWESQPLSPTQRAAFGRYADALGTFTRALHDAGAPLVLGTDFGNAWVYPGQSLHEEIAEFVSAGLPPHTVLRLATAGAAEALRMSDRVGTVQVGKQADLVIVETDPRDDPAILKQPAFVIIRGEVASAADLDASLEELAATLAGAHGPPAPLAPLHTH